MDFLIFISLFIAFFFLFSCHFTVSLFLSTDYFVLLNFLASPQVNKQRNNAEEILIVSSSDEANHSAETTKRKPYQAKRINVTIIFLFPAPNPISALAATTKADFKDRL